jgi:hypothetical protein
MFPSVRAARGPSRPAAERSILEIDPMRALPISLSILGLLSVAAAVARAQWYVDNQASTVGESYARGMSDVIRSRGQYNLDTSAAAINASQARSNEIKNYADATNTYFEMRAANKAYRQKERGKRATSEDWVRWAKEGAPKPLSPGDFDPVTGKIHWPVTLREDAFAKYREQLDALFAKRASSEALTVQDFIEVDKLTKALLEDLKAHVKEVPAHLYIASKEFVKSLAYEVRRPS